MRALPEAPALAVGPDAAATAPFLVTHWYCGSATRRYMVVRRFREVLAAADLEPGHRVLDLGCGWGYGSLWARAAGSEVAGIDLGLDQLHWARVALDPGRALGLVQGDAGRLPFRSASFDRAVSVEMMEHVYRPDRAAVLREIARVLRPGGRLALSTPNAGSPVERVKRWAVRWPALRRRLPASCFPEAEDRREAYHPYRYHHPLTTSELADGLAAAGLALGGVRHFLWVPKILPAPLLPLGRAAERVAEAIPVVRRLGATTLVWAVRR